MGDLRVQGLMSQSGLAEPYILEILVMSVRRMWIPKIIKTINHPLGIGKVYAILPRLKKR